ncbi:SDR family oxidoreductase [Luteimonas sp. FCS-9]|uniref:SDR family oxidoreductase n=1 Tax=Luteimonas sp. FCS-9 TaxID=1547516 RepID=UPI0031B59FB3
MLVVGATGLIGRAIAERLEREGHAVVLAVRRAAVDDAGPGRRVALDLARPCRRRWMEALRSVDVVVNAAGIFQETADASFEHVHVSGPCTLFELAAAAGVARIVQISALGADERAATAYWRSKAAGDACARAFPGTHVVVRPSLVFAETGASTRLFLTLAAQPVVALPGGGRQLVQPIHLDDLVDGVTALLAHPAPPPLIEAVGPAPLSFADYLRTLAAQMGHRLRVLPAPAWAVRAVSRLPMPASVPLPDADALRMLDAGSHGDAAAWQALLARPLRPATGFLASSTRSDVRDAARLRVLVPVMRLADSLMWLVTAWVSAFVYPVPASLDLLQRAHVPAAFGLPALYGAAALDAVLGLAVWHRRWRRGAYRAQLALIAFYTLVISVWLPEYWAHPYGPVLKNLPVLALVYALLKLDDPDGHRPR